MDALSTPLLIYYVVVIAVFCTYGVHRYWQVWLFLRSGGLRAKSGGADAPDAPLETLPRVTVQLPMFNERHVAQRIIEAACALDYPRDRLQVQVLDDSTDESAGVVRRCCERLAAAGHDVEHRHRRDRSGFKAGALADAMATATGDLIAMFDADFVPPPDLLQRIVPHFADPAVGMAQARWTHLNRGDSLLTEIQALGLDGHFVIEQTARSRTGRWFNFNGTAGVWRRACIDDAGGWQHDTLTEDTDLSYRAQLAGWRFVYLPDVTCPAELPPTMSALMTQQHRWSKGLVQNAIKLLPRILRSRAPWRTKVEAFFHLTSPVPYAAMFLLTLLVTPAFWIGLPTTGISAWLALGLGILCLGMGTCAAGVFAVASQAAQGRSVFRALLRLPALMAIGIGMSWVNTRAIVEALIGRNSPFVRTPKFAGEGESATDPGAAVLRIVPPGTVELFLGALMATGAALAVAQPFTLVGVPFLVLFASGYLAVGLAPLRAALARLRRAVPIGET